jgi:hypothetical protein
LNCPIVEIDAEKLGKIAAGILMDLIAGRISAPVRITLKPEMKNTAAVNRGEIKLDRGIDPNLAYKIASYHWDVMGPGIPNERGTFDFKTRGDRFCCSVGMMNGQPAILSVTTTPGRLELLVGKEAYQDNANIHEMTTTSAAQGYNIPGAFSRKGGSKAGVESSAGYTLTSTGKKDMELKADRLYEDISAIVYNKLKKLIK